MPIPAIFKINEIPNFFSFLQKDDCRHQAENQTNRLDAFLFVGQTFLQFVTPFGQKIAQRIEARYLFIE